MASGIRLLYACMPASCPTHGNLWFPSGRIEPFSPRDLRRTFAGDMLNSGADLAPVQQLMGHSSPSTTAGYDRRPKAARQRAAGLVSVPPGVVGGGVPGPLGRGAGGSARGLPRAALYRPAPFRGRGPQVGKAKDVPLLPEVARALLPLRGKPKDPVFPKIPSMERFRADLKAARIEEEDARRRKVVLHSLRHSLATMPAKSQIPPAITMKITWHRDIKLTLDVHTDEGPLSAAATMNSLPKLMGSATA